MLCFSMAAPAMLSIAVLGIFSNIRQKLGLGKKAVDTTTPMATTAAISTTLAESAAEAAAPSTSRGWLFGAGGDSKTESLIKCQDRIDELLLKTNANPVMVRLAWHDSGTYDASLAKRPWPNAGGAIGSIIYAPEIEHGANAGLAAAVDMLRPIKQKFPAVSWADIIQMASARSIELAGGPKLKMRYGRVDCAGPEACSKEGNLPDAEAGPNGMYGSTKGTKPTEDAKPGDHLKKVFYRMGMNDEEIVALSGAHTLGRAYKDRSGLGAEKTKYTDGAKQLRGDGKEAAYTPGGSSWTKEWLKFDNSYFETIPDEDADPELLKLSTDKALFNDFFFRSYAEKFRKNQTLFFEKYAKAHVKLSELGSKFEFDDGIYLNLDAAEVKQAKTK